MEAQQKLSKKSTVGKTSKKGKYHWEGYRVYTKGGRITRFRIPHPPALFWNEYSIRRSEVREKIRFASRNKAAPPNKESKNKTSTEKPSEYFGGN